jgi:hypothetical protein
VRRRYSGNIHQYFGGDMKLFLITLIILFYVFFFMRALILSRALGKNIKAKNTLLNISIFSAGLSSAIFLACLTAPPIMKYLLILFSSKYLTIIGSVLITLG